MSAFQTLPIAAALDFMDTHFFEIIIVFLLLSIRNSIRLNSTQFASLHSLTWIIHSEYEHAV
jgi:hypothetical protein